VKKQIILIILIISLIMNCGNGTSSSNKNVKQYKLSENEKSKIEQETSKINDDTTNEELENMMTTAKLNYNSNPEIGRLYFEKLVKYKPEAARYLADYYYNLKDYPNYEKWEKKAIELGIDSSIYNLAHYYDEIGNYAESEKWYLEYIKKHKDSEDALTNLAIVYAKHGNYSESEKYLKGLGLTDGNAMYYLGMHYATVKDYKKAEEVYNKMIESGNPDGYFGLASLYEEMYKNKWSKVEKISALYKKGADMGEPKSAWKIASKKFKLRYYEEAKKYYLIAYNKNLFKADAAFNIGLICNIQHNYTESRRWFQIALDLGIVEAKQELKEIEGKW